MVVIALEVWRHYFYGVHVDVFIDHKSSQYLFIHRDVNLRQRRWLELLNTYDMGVLHHHGKAIAVVDTLSKLSICIVCHIESNFRLVNFP